MLSDSLPEEPKILITNSSSVAGYSYDAQAYVLTVFYKGKGSAVYQFFNCYPGVVSQIFDQPNKIGKELKEQVKGLMFKKIK